MNDHSKEDTSPGDDRRVRPRRDLSFPVILSDDQSTVLTGRTINLSDRGIFLITEVGDVKLGDMVNVKLELGGETEEGKPRVLEAQARVVRVEGLSGLALYLSDALQIEPKKE